MIDDYQEVMELMNKMKNCLPIPAYPSKVLISLLKQRNIKIKSDEYVEIVDIFYCGDEGGISCSLKFPFTTTEHYVLSLTHLRPVPNHPLAKDLRKYQIHRIRNLARQ